MHVLALCAGIGGLELGLKLATGNAARTVCICEGEAYCASVLRARMQDGNLDDCPIWSDVRTFDPDPWRGKVDCITAGYPCQPFSHAGRRKGTEDPRHLWPHIAAHVRVLRPRYVFCENVPGHVTLGFEQVCEDLCGMGYSIEAGIFSAAEVGAPHLRKRLFFLAHDDGGAVRPQFRGQQRPGRNAPVQPWRDGEAGHVADAAGQRQLERLAKQVSPSRQGCQVWTGPERSGANVANADSDRQRGGRASQPQAQMATAAREGGSIDDGSRGALGRLGELASGHSALVDHLARGWPDDWEDGVPRVTTSQPHRIDRLRALGNAVVPQTAALAWTTLMQQAIDRDR